MGKIIRTAVILGAVIVGSIIGGPIGAMIGSIIATAATSVLFPLKKPKLNMETQQDRLYANIDITAPRKMVLGRTAMATDIRFESWDDDTDQTYLHRIIAVAAHKVHSIEEIYFDTDLAWSTAGGIDAKFTGYLDVTTVLEGDAGNTITIGDGSVWGASQRLTGCAYIYIKYRVKTLDPKDKDEQSPFTSGIANRVTIIGDGCYNYDPRLDSTVSGGSGSQRADDQSTRTYVSAIQQNNLPLLVLNYLLGWKINGILSVGKGIPPSRIDLVSFIDAANLAEESVTRAVGGTEPRYVGGAIASESDEPESVLGALLDGCNSYLTDSGGFISIKTLSNDLASPVAEFFDDDFLSEFTWDPWDTLHDSPNVVRGRYVDSTPAGLYQFVDFPPVSIASVDGIERSISNDYIVVESASQAQRLASQKLQRLQFPGKFEAPMKLVGLKATIGNVVEITFGPLAFVAKLFRVVGHRVESGKLILTFKEENAAFYAWDNDDSAPVIGGTPLTFDPTKAPILEALKNGATNPPDQLDVYLSRNPIFIGTSKTGVGNDYSLASGNFVAKDAEGNDVSSNFALSIAPGGNPYSLTIGFAGQTYSVTGGYTSAKTGTISILATGSGYYTDVIFVKQLVYNPVYNAITLAYIPNANDQNNLIPDQPGGLASLSISKTFDTGNVSVHGVFTFTSNSNPDHKNNIDGYRRYVWVADTNAAHTLGTSANEEVADLEANLTAGTYDWNFLVDRAANKWYTVGVSAIRRVHSSVNAKKIIEGPIRQVGPYQPSGSQNFVGGVGGQSASNVANWSSYASLGLNSDGTVKTGKVTEVGGLSAINVSSGSLRAIYGMLVDGTIQNDKVIESSIGDGSINDAFYAYDSSTIVLTSSAYTQFFWNGSFSITNGEIECLMELPYQFFLTNPTTGTEAYANSYLTAQPLGGGTIAYSALQDISDVWTAADGVGTFTPGKKVAMLHHKFTGLTPGTWQVGFYVIRGTNGLTLPGSKRIYTNNPRAQR